MQELDCTKVIKLSEADRHFDGTEDVMRPPAIGDVGTIVMVHRTAAEIVAYTVECVGNDGDTIWLSDFLPEEVQPIN